MIFADLHIHSKYSRATSPDMNMKNLSHWAKIKGLGLMGTGDMTHPKWLQEIKSTVSEDSGILHCNGTDFILSGEISLIYTAAGKVRKVHLVILSPGFEVTDQINSWLLKKGRIDYDGRPIFGFSCIEFMDAVASISKDIAVIPAHIWTPHFSLFGSNSGFDSIEECFEDKIKYVTALETGLSSDPAMNRKISMIDNYPLVSFSDSHSLWRIGRECTVLGVEDLTYKNIINAIKNKIRFTVEVDPSYGKYHFDGHRACNICIDPVNTINNKMCPKCKKPLTIGVLHRVEELADRKQPKNVPDFKTMLPLQEILSLVYSLGTGTKTITSKYNGLIQKYGSEFNILMQSDLSSMEDKKLAGVLMKNRFGKIFVEHGYDGVYGKPAMESEQKTLRNLL